MTQLCLQSNSSTYSISLPFISSDEAPVSFCSESCKGTQCDLIEASTWLSSFSAVCLLLGRKSVPPKSTTTTKNLLTQSCRFFCQSSCRGIEVYPHGISCIECLHSSCALKKGLPNHSSTRSIAREHSAHQSWFLRRQVRAVSKESSAPFHSTEHAPMTCWQVVVALLLLLC
jgi:hypothetical protein